MRKVRQDRRQQGRSGSGRMLWGRIDGKQKRGKVGFSIPTYGENLHTYSIEDSEKGRRSLNLKYSGTWKIKKQHQEYKSNVTHCYIQVFCYIPVFPNIPVRNHTTYTNRTASKYSKPWNVIFAVLEYKNAANP